MATARGSADESEGAAPPTSEIELHVAPFDQGQHVFEPGVVGCLAGGDINGHRDLEQAQPGLVERLEPVGDAVQPDMADTVIAQFLEHDGLFLERALFGIVPIDAERKEGEGFGCRHGRVPGGGAAG